MEEVKASKERLLLQVNSSSSQHDLYSRNEDELRKKIEALLHQINEQEKALRDKNEEVYKLQSEKNSLGCDLGTLKQQEQLLMRENEDGKQKRLEAEDIIQDLKRQVYAQQSAIRKAEEDHEYLRRECQAQNAEKQ